MLFNKEEIDLILKVPLSAMGAKDKLVWKLERDDQYSMSSGYNLAMQIIKSKDRREETSSAAIDRKNFWSRLWGLRAKKKILYFLWRDINNSLPVLQNVAKRGMKYNPIYSRCGEDLETVEHVMFECHFT